jgi:hypothetical protein
MYLVIDICNSQSALTIDLLEAFVGFGVGLQQICSESRMTVTDISNQVHLTAF